EGRRQRIREAAPLLLAPSSAHGPMGAARGGLAMMVGGTPLGWPIDNPGQKIDSPPPARIVAVSLGLCARQRHATRLGRDALRWPRWEAGARMAIRARAGAAPCQLWAL